MKILGIKLLGNELTPTMMLGRRCSKEDAKVDRSYFLLWKILENIVIMYSLPNYLKNIKTAFITMKMTEAFGGRSDDLTGPKRNPKDSEGVVIGDNWTDIKPVQSQARKRIGYPTQKPEALLKRIIQCANNAGDTVFDPVVGGDTTVAVADRLKHQWIGIDQSVQAIKVSDQRVQKQRNLFSVPFVVQLHKYEYDTRDEL